MSTIPQILKDCRASMEKGLDAAKREFASVRSGKASPNMLDTVRVEMYGQQMMLNQVASIAAPEPRTILVTPFDKGQIKAIERRSASRISASSRRRRAARSASPCRR